MKKLAVLIALLLALSPAASALTLTHADVEAPKFQWDDYSLTLSLITDEPGEMDYLPYPAQGSLVMVRLASTKGQIALTDIRAGAQQFLLRDATGAVNNLFVWHVDGVKDDGSKVSSPLQDAFELVYSLPAGVSPEGATLLLRNPDGRERKLLQFPGAAQAPITESGTATQPTEGPGPDERAAEFISLVLSEEAKGVTDPWTLAILEAGAQGVTLQDGAIGFSLRSFNPGLKSIEETEPAEFLGHLFENASAYDLVCSLVVTDDGGLAATDKARKALMKAIQKAAGQSKKAFDDKKVRAALAGYLLGSGAYDMEYSVPLGDFSPLFSGQSKQTLSVKDGPHALKLGTTGAKAEDMIKKAYTAALQRLSKQEGAKDLSESAIASVFLEELNAQAAVLKKKGKEKREFVINLDELFSKEYRHAGDDFNDFLYDFSGAYSSNLTDLKKAVLDFPDYPAVDFPKSGRVDGSKSGTQVICKIPKDGFARFIQMRKVDSGELAVSAFIRPGEKATVRVPKGMYYIMVAYGYIWYGEEHLFGDSGDYSRTEDIQIKGSSYYHVITLGGVKDGNMSSYDADPSEFQ